MLLLYESPHKYTIRIYTHINTCTQAHAMLMINDYACFLFLFAKKERLYKMVCLYRSTASIYNFLTVDFHYRFHYKGNMIYTSTVFVHLCVSRNVWYLINTMLCTFKANSIPVP